MEMILILLFVLWCDLTQTVDIIITVEQSEIHLAHILFVYFEIFHLLVHAVLFNQCICHFDSEWFDWVTVANLKHRKVFVIVVRDFLLAAFVTASHDVCVWGEAFYHL